MKQLALPKQKAAVILAVLAILNTKFGKSNFLGKYFRDSLVKSWILGIMIIIIKLEIFPRLKTLSGYKDCVNVAPPQREGATLSAKYPPLTFFSPSIADSKICCFVSLFYQQ